MINIKDHDFECYSPTNYNNSYLHVCKICKTILLSDKRNIEDSESFYPIELELTCEETLIKNIIK